MKAKWRWRDLDMKYKLVIMLYLVMLPFLLFLSGTIYALVLKNVNDEVNEAYSGVANQIHSSVDYLMRDIEDISSYLIINDTIHSILNSKDPDSDVYRIGFSDQSLRFINNIIATKSHINSFAIYSFNGLPPYTVTTDTGVFKPDYYDVMQTDLYNRALEAHGASIWQYIPRSDNTLFVRNRSDKIALARVIFNYNINKPIGYMIFGINAGYVRDILSSLKSDKDCIAVVYRGQPLATTALPELFVWSERTAPEGYTVIKDSKGANGLSVYYYMADSGFEERYGFLGLVPIVILTGSLLLLYPISSFAASKITRPLGELLVSMKAFEKGDFNQRVNFEAKDEIGEVGRRYNKMVKSIRELIEKNYASRLRERESELAALQAQIKPHFLYNTLDSIYWKALEEGNKKIANMIYSLSRLFRLSLNRGSSMTTLCDEAEFLTHYLEIQKERFGGKLKVKINIEEGAKNCKLPKLLLQPFVENAIKHGIEKSEKGGEVELAAKKDNGMLHVRISDTGGGMTQEKIKEVFKCTQSHYSDSFAGYAIYNVNERLRLKYGDNYTLNVSSAPGAGTQIDIVLPCE